jgi:hypothetical protein
MALLELCLLYHFYYIFLKILVFNTGSHNVPLTGIEFTVHPTLALILLSQLPIARVTDMGHHAQVICHFKEKKRRK